MQVAIIGAGSGGQAIAGYLSMIGHEVALYDRSEEKVAELNSLGGIRLEGCVEGTGRPRLVTNSLEAAVRGASLIMVVTVANAHKELAQKMAPLIEDGQVIVLNPGRTCGALVFREALNGGGCNKRYYLGEAQTLIYACRVVRNGVVNIIGVKDEVLLSGLPAIDTGFILELLSPLYPCFQPAPNVLYTSLENIGAIFHPCICLLNAATIERQDEFRFYTDMTEQVAHFIEKFDEERIAVGKAYGIDLISVKDWVKEAYKDTKGDTLQERLINNPAYREIKGPWSIFTRQLTEDIPTGVLPILELGKLVGLKMPLMDAMVNVIETLLCMDMHTDGRTLEALGLKGMTKSEIIKFVENGK